jgi:hypothetical protein
MASYKNVPLFDSFEGDDGFKVWRTTFLTYQRKKNAETCKLLEHWSQARTKDESAMRTIEAQADDEHNAAAKRPHLDVFRRNAAAPDAAPCDRAERMG